MKKATLAFLTALAVVPALAEQPSPVSSAAPQVISVQTLREGDVDISLPTIRNADGSICVSYLASSSRDAENKLTTEVSRICGPAGPNGEAGPAQLLSMREFRTGSLAVQLPTTKAQ
ncbi:hypothetical protein [Paraburkholderia sacchari]|uniref:Uncharacterized protein n=1 Tax=Paraburkholderia sacchari TaxID=159450 RepID=A0A8T6ZLU7_9BURK|nr:hypothetical protein [Paraburkholderia sacchari]NLP65555.1 hypothetical protein [Paraburkholderia sacchari]